MNLSCLAFVYFAIVQEFGQDLTAAVSLVVSIYVPLLSPEWALRVSMSSIEGQCQNLQMCFPMFPLPSRLFLSLLFSLFASFFASLLCLLKIMSLFGLHLGSKFHLLLSRCLFFGFWMCSLTKATWPTCSAELHQCWPVRHGNTCYHKCLKRQSSSSTKHAQQ